MSQTIGSLNQNHSFRLLPYISNFKRNMFSHAFFELSILQRNNSMFKIKENKIQNLIRLFYYLVVLNTCMFCMQVCMCACAHMCTHTHFLSPLLPSYTQEFKHTDLLLGVPKSRYTLPRS